MPTPHTRWRAAKLGLLQPASLAALLLCLTHAACAQEPAPAKSDRGFSYFLGLGRQDVRYEESLNLAPVKSSARTSSPLIVTGALYAVNDDLLLSMNSEFTFYPGEATERWNYTGPSLAAANLSSPLLQSNGYSLNQSSTQLLGHYRVAGPWFAVAGTTLHSMSFKRYGFVSGPDNAVDTPPANTVVEETTGEVLLNLGLALESERVQGSAEHFGVRALLGVPAWRRTQNTDVQNLRFTRAQGLDLAIEGRYSRAIYRGVHLGAWGKWLTSRRGRETLGGNELPESKLDSLSYGLELLWKL